MLTESMQKFNDLSTQFLKNPENAKHLTFVPAYANLYAELRNHYGHDDAIKQMNLSGDFKDFFEAILALQKDLEEEYKTYRSNLESFKEKHVPHKKMVNVSVNLATHNGDPLIDVIAQTNFSNETMVTLIALAQAVNVEESKVENFINKSQCHFTLNFLATAYNEAFEKQNEKNKVNIDNAHAQYSKLSAKILPLNNQKNTIEQKNTIYLEALHQALKSMQASLALKNMKASKEGEGKYEKHMPIIKAMLKQIESYKDAELKVRDNISATRVLQEVKDIYQKNKMEFKRVNTSNPIYKFFNKILDIFSKTPTDRAFSFPSYTMTKHSSHLKSIFSRAESHKPNDEPAPKNKPGLKR